MDDSIRAAFETDLTIDITTIGRSSGRPRRIEMWFHNLDGRIFLTGTPGARDWYANLVADQRFTFHLKESVVADLDAVAAPITDEAERRPILAELTRRLGTAARLEDWVAHSPLVEVAFSG